MDKSDDTSALPQERSHFDQIPWCATLLSGPGITTFIPPSRNVKDHLHDQFFGRILNSPTVIPACVSFYKLSPPSSPTERDEIVVECSTLFALSHGVNGYPGVAHGGVVAALLDEAMGILIELNIGLGKENVNPVFGMDPFTATMELRFRRPVVTPGVVLGSARIKEIKGRKIQITATIKNEYGEELAGCESLWLAVEKARL
jgi:acyl-coenzyme A thioesterase PaaI-like protein